MSFPCSTRGPSQIFDATSCESSCFIHQIVASILEKFVLILPKGRSQCTKNKGDDFPQIDLVSNQIDAGSQHSQLPGKVLYFPYRLNLHINF